MKKKASYAALDLHSENSVLGSIDHEGNSQGLAHFATEAETLRKEVLALKKKGGPLYLTLEAGALTRWAVGIIRPLVDRLIVCEPRYNRLINTNPTKCDEADVEAMCLLLRLNKLKEVWMGNDRAREIYRALVYELLNWRDAQRELKALIKARYRQWGVLKLHGLKVFSKIFRRDYLAQLPGEEEQGMMKRLYLQHDQAVAQWKETLQGSGASRESVLGSARISTSARSWPDCRPCFQRDRRSAGAFQNQGATAPIQCVGDNGSLQ